MIAGQRLSMSYDADYRPFFGGFYTADLSIVYDKRPGVFGTQDRAELTWASGDGVTIFIWPSPWFWLAAGVFTVLLIGSRVRGRVVGKRSIGLGRQNKV